MTYLKALLIVFGTLLVVLPVLLWLIQRACKAELAKADPDEVGPDDPRLPAGINRLLDDYAALDPDLRHVFGPNTNNHTTTNPTGDQTP